MKTLLVVYTDDRLTKKQHQTMKRYSFNTKSPVKVGDRFECDLYTTAMQVVEVLPQAFKFVNIHTGALSNKKERNTKQYEIRELSIRSEHESDVIEATRLP